MDPQTLAPLYLFWDALAVLGILSGLVLALAGYRVFERVAQLPGLILGVLIAGGLAYLLWHEPLPTIAGAAIGGWVGAAIIRAHRNALIFASGAWLGLLVAVALAALLAVMMQRMPAPSVLLLLFVAMPVVGGFLAWHHERLMITLATAFSGAGLIVGGLARLSMHASGGYADANLPATMLLGSLVLGVVGVIVQYRGPTAAREQTDRTNPFRGTDKVFRNPQPPRWDRPRPVVLPEAVEMKHRSDGTAFNSRWIRRLDIAPDGGRLGVTTDSGYVFIVDPTDGNLVQSISSGGCYQLSLTCRGQLTGVIANSAHSGWHTVFLCEAEADTVDVCRTVDILGYTGADNRLAADHIAISADDRWFAAHRNRTLYIGEMAATCCASPELTVSRSGERGRSATESDYVPCDGLAFHPRSEWLALVSSLFGSSSLYFYDPDSDRWLSSLLWSPFHFVSEALGSRYPTPAYPVFRKIPAVHRIATDADGSVMGLLGGASVTLLRIRTRESLFLRRKRVAVKHTGTVECDADGLLALAISPDSRLVVAAGEGAEIRIWDTKTRRQYCELTSYEERATLGDVNMGVNGVAMHPNGRWLFSAGRSGLIRRWTLIEESGGWRAVCDMAMEALPDGNWVVWRDPDGPNRCWVNPSPEAQRWLGWRMPSGGDFADYRPFDAFKC